MKKGIAVVIIALFIVSAVSPMVIGLESDAIECDVEKEKLLDNLAFYCYGPYGLNTEKYEILKERLLKDYSEDKIDVKAEVQIVEPISSYGPMDSPWPMQSHDNTHTGRSPYNTSDVDGLEKWRLACGWVDTAPVIDNDGIIYFGGGYGGLPWYLYSVFPNGTLRWRYKTGGAILGSSPAIAEDGTIYVGSWDGYLYSINSNGTLKWKFKTGDIEAISSSPTISEEGIIYVGTMDNKVFAINPNGTEKWRYKTGSDVTASPTIGDDGSVYIGSRDRYFYSFYPNGTLNWRYKTGDYVRGSASIADDNTIYVGSFDGYLYALYPNGTIRWKSSIGVGTQANPSIASDGTIYVGGEKLYAIYPNGTRKWTFNPGNQRRIVWSSPAISSDGTIYFGTNIGDAGGGEIIAVNPDGTEKWRKKIADDWVDSSPSIAEDDTVYIGGVFDLDWEMSYLHAFGPVESNEPPEISSISGETNGRAGKEYLYKFTAQDLDNNPVSFFIEWGDGQTTGWTRDYASGEEMRHNHIWDEQGEYTIRAKARDTLGEESDWAYLEVTMPKNQNMQFGWLSRFPLLQRLLSSPVLNRLLFH